MNKANLDVMLKQWAQATAPDSATLARLHARISSDLVHSSASFFKGIPAPVVCSPWSRVLAQVASLAILVATGFILWGQRPLHPLEVVEVRTSGTPGAVEDSGGLQEAIASPGGMQCVQLVQRLRTHMIFMEVSQMPGVAGPYRAETIMRVAIPSGELEWLTMASVIWEELLKVN